MLDTDRPARLEDVLAKAEADADAALKAAAAVTSALKRFRVAAQVGKLRDLRQAIGASEQALTTLQQQFANARDGYDFDEDRYFADGSYPRELLDTAARMSLRIFELDDRLYCYPALIRVLPNDQAVLIDKVRERRLRPSVLVTHLRELQRKPPRFKPEAFLETLFSAYGVLGATRGKGFFGDGPVEKLVDIYNLLTLLPGQSKEYSMQEFARDIYLLDRSGVTATRKGPVVSFPASTGTRRPASSLKIVSEHGEEKVYYGIAFSTDRG